MEVLEDMRLGFRAKRAGYAQRVAFGKDLVTDSLGRKRVGHSEQPDEKFVFHVSLSHLSVARSVSVYVCHAFDSICCIVLSRTSAVGGHRHAIRAAAAEPSLLAADRYSAGVPGLFPVATLLFVGNAAAFHDPCFAARRSAVARDTVSPLDESALYRLARCGDPLLVAAMVKVDTMLAAHTVVGAESFSAVLRGKTFHQLRVRMKVFGLTRCSCYF